MNITSDEFYKLKTTLKALDSLARQREAHEKEEDALKQQLKNIQTKCPHAWEHIPDASGNNDSYHHCLICGLDK